MPSAARPAGRPPGLPVSFAWQGPPRSPRSRAAAGRRAAIAQRPLRVEGRPRSVRGADRRTTAPASHTGGPGIPRGQSCMTASDQHQPASSRAMATSAMTGRFFRAVNTSQRWCNRWFPAWPRARAAAGALVPTGPHGEPGTVGLAVVPGRLDQQPAGVGVPGLGDRALGALPAGGGLGGHQPEVGTDGGSGEPMPVTDLDGQPEPGQRGHPTQTTQPAHHRGVLAAHSHLGDRVIQPVPAGRGEQHRLERGIERQLQPRQREMLPAQPLLVHPGPRMPTGIQDPLAQQQFSTTDAGTASNHHGHLPGPGPDPSPPPVPRSAPGPRRSDPSATAWQGAARLENRS